jgi:putative transposase
VLDLFSRYVVGWMLAHRESGELARRLIAQAFAQQRIASGSLTVHADRGSAPTAKTLTQLYSELGIEPSLSRPRVSNDNPFSEAQFKTLKYAPGYPGRFGSFEDARGWCREFFFWYNAEHRHSGIAYLTPEAVHYGHGPALLQARGRALARAYALHPERFVKGAPSPQTLPDEVWINAPKDGNTIEINSPSPKANLDSKPQLLVRGAH